MTENSAKPCRPRRAASQRRRNVCPSLHVCAML